MALLNDVPKYGLSTAFSLVPCDKSVSGADESADSGQDTNNTNHYHRISEAEFVDLIHAAMRLGCRHFDCAPQFGTQKLVGATLRKLMRSSGVQRDKVFITSRVPVSQMSTGDMIEKSFRSTLAELQLTFIDLYMVQAPGSSGTGGHYGDDNEHWPRDAEGNLQVEQAEELLAAAWIKLVELKKTGQIRYIGACNVTIKQLDRLYKIYPLDVVQHEYHLYSQDRDLFDYCEELDVHYEALVTVNWKANPGANSANNSNGDINDSENNNLAAELKQLTPNSKQSAAVRLADPVIDRIASANKMSRPQLMIQWLHKQPLSYVIFTKTIDQLEDNFKSCAHIKVSLNDLIELDSLNTCMRPQLAAQNSQ